MNEQLIDVYPFDDSSRFDAKNKNPVREEDDLSHIAGDEEDSLLFAGQCDGVERTEWLVHEQGWKPSVVVCPCTFC